MPIEFVGITYTDIKLPCNRENMTILVEALESGEYTQGYGQLRITEAYATEEQPEGFCCLGVACDKSGQGTWSESGLYITPGVSTGSPSLMPAEVSAWLGVDGSDLQVGAAANAEDFLTASMLNDEDREGEPLYPFPKIAAILRQVYLTD